MDCCHWEIEYMAAVYFDVFEDDALGDSMLAVTINPKFLGRVIFRRAKPWMTDDLFV